jgi:hypothetical protein
MHKFVRFLTLSAVVAGGAASLPGCGSGFNDSQPNLSQTQVARFAGTYNGTFTGVIAAGLPGAGQTVGGTFTAVVDSQGNVTGSVSQPGIGQFPASGTVTSDGRITVVAQPGSGQRSTLTGNATANGNGFTLAGSFTTVSNGVTAVSGTFTGTRR